MKNSRWASLGITSLTAWAQTTSPPSAPVRPPSPPMIAGLPDIVTVAFISALSALVAVVLKDLLFKLWEEHRNRRKELDEVYARYADPLASAAVSLMWRLNEALNQPGRGRFLLVKGIPSARNRFSTFGAYKKTSTLYRLAVLLGWLRACRREFSYLKLAHQEANKAIDDSIAEFEKALADGPQVELERFQQLCDLWRVQVPKDTHVNSTVPVDLEASVASFLETSELDGLNALDQTQRRKLCEDSASLICSRLNVNGISSTVLDQTWGQAFEIIAVREAWVYRDWQSAIGDLMIRKAEQSDRRFDVIGFSEFEAICTEGTDDQRKWVNRLSAIFDEIDVAVTNRFDHRPKQLKAVLRATAILVKALAGSNAPTQQVSSKSLDLARSLATPSP
jgi:hypothetical protein